MDKRVKKAMLAALDRFSADSEEVSVKLVDVFDSGDDYLNKVDALDQVFDDYPRYEDLRESFFDLLLINFFNEDVRKLEEDYLESPEWEAIEEQTIDRGTELLNLILYLRECADEDIEPELDDFLKEFLLVDDDEFQDEHRIYEDVIANQILTESSVDEISRVAADLPASSEMKELFYPVMAFFRDQNPDEKEFASFVKHSNNPDFDAAIYSLLINFNQNQ